MAEPEIYTDMYLANKLRHKLANEKAQTHWPWIMDVYKNLSDAIIKETAAGRRSAALLVRSIDCAHVQALATYSWVFPTLSAAVDDLTWTLIPDVPAQTTIIELHWSY